MAHGNRYICLGGYLQREQEGLKIGDAKIAGSKVAVSGKVITITGVTVVEGQPIIISGVKYADLFPSYSFTFTMQYAE